uniref:Uncharacterized protein n=1 Tax=Heterorhabditis bacteriophora TaxID=37862 RepID=A0A1I7WNU8_HETBA
MKFKLEIFKHIKPGFKKNYINLVTENKKIKNRVCYYFEVECTILVKKCILTFIVDSLRPSRRIDLAAIIIQMGRDHGIPGYLDWRRFCGLENLQSFSAISGQFKSSVNISDFVKIYEAPEDIDLFVGGLAELPVKGALLGPTFACLFAKQMERVSYTYCLKITLFNKVLLGFYFYHVLKFYRHYLIILNDLGDTNCFLIHCYGYI